MSVDFHLVTTDGAARRGRISTAHGPVETPAFMPVGTAATVKAMKPEEVAQAGFAMILANTYHLMLRPEPERIAQLGGLHKFMNWPGPILTDSGGYQVMSLAKLRKISEQGVSFRSHLDGAKFLLTPERAVEIQHLLGADISMAFDECTPFPATHKEAESSMNLSMRWAERSMKAFAKRPGYGLFGINQGGIYPDLRLASSQALTAIGFDGYAIGGLAVGEGQKAMFKVLDETAPSLPEDKPRYLMGVGKPGDLLGAVQRGMDLFDCVLPTRSGRTAQAFTRFGTVNLRNARHQDDKRPLDESCDCGACAKYSRAYLHHLSRAGEILGAMLLTGHNLRYYGRLMEQMRAAIADKRLGDLSDELTRDWARGDIPPR